MTAQEIRDIIQAFADDPSIDPIVKATGISSIYQITTELRGPAQEAAVAKVYELGYVGGRRLGNIFFLHDGERYVLNSAYRTYKCDHIKEYAQAMRIADKVKKQAIVNCKAVEEGMTLGPNDIPPAKYKVTNGFVRRIIQKNGTAFYSKSKRSQGIRDPLSNG